MQLIEDCVDDHDEMDLPIAIGVACPCTVILILTIIVGAIVAVVFLFFLKGVNYDEYGIIRDSLSGTIDASVVYEPGLHFMFPTRSFVTFSRLLQNVDIGDLNIRTLDGANIEAYFSFQYTVTPETIKFFAGTFRYTETRQITNYIENIVQNTLRDFGNKFTTVEYYTDRPLIRERFLEEVKTLVNNITVDVPFLQYQDVSFPQLTEEGIANALVRQQEVEIAGLEQQLQFIRSETEVLLENILRRLQTIDFDKRGTLNFLESSAQANSTIVRLEAEKDAYNIIKSGLGFDNNQLLTYLFYEAMSQSGKSTAGNSVMTVNMKNPVILRRT